MSERGTFAIDRGLFDHPVFKDEPYTEREAWTWLIAEAAYRPRRRRVSSLTVWLQRGELVASLRYIAERWQWSEPRVRRFLRRLETNAMIDLDTDAGITIITIKNYDKYQWLPRKIEARSDAPSDAVPTQYRRSSDAAATQRRKK